MEIEPFCLGYSFSWYLESLCEYVCSMHTYSISCVWLLKLFFPFCWLPLYRNGGFFFVSMLFIFLRSHVVIDGINSSHIMILMKNYYLVLILSFLICRVSFLCLDSWFIHCGGLLCLIKQGLKIFIILCFNKSVFIIHFHYSSFIKMVVEAGVFYTVKNFENFVKN